MFSAENSLELLPWWDMLVGKIQLEGEVGCGVGTMTKMSSIIEKEK